MNQNSDLAISCGFYSPLFWMSLIVTAHVFPSANFAPLTAVFSVNGIFFVKRMPILAMSMGLAAVGHMPSLLHAVPRVIAWGAKAKMVWVHAKRNVTFVHDIQALRDFPEMHLP